MTDETRPLHTAIDRPSPEVIKAYAALSPNELSDVLELSCVMRYEIHPLWPNPPRIAGPAFTIRTGRHDNLMFHASIYLAQPGDVIVVEAGDDEMAVAGGNVCAIAQRNETQKPSEPHNIGHFFLAIDPRAFRGEGEFENDLDQVIDVLHGAKRADPAQPVLVAGDPEMGTREERLRDGVPVPDDLVDQLREVAQQRRGAVRAGVGRDDHES